MGVMQTGEGRPYAADRRRRLVAMLKEREYCTIHEMSQEIGISLMTVRRDLHVLAREQIVQLLHGGARLTAQAQVEPTIGIRLHERLPQKQAIGELAAKMFVKAGDVIGIDGGSTTVHVACHLPAVPLTVVTNSLTTANAIAEYEQCNLQMLGGTFLRESSIFTGTQTIAALQELRLHKLFLAAAGLRISDGLSSTYMFDAEVKKALMGSAQEVILCLDSTKIGRVFLAYFAALEEIDVLVTDDGITPEDKAAIEARDVRVVVASFP
jgi:DeoR/GlpR family transcriptional regulator of sugar metabolism